METICRCIELWASAKWMDLSKAGATNRKSIPVKGCTSSYVRHTGGFVNFSIHRRRLELENRKRPTEIELFERLHKKDKGKGAWCDMRAQAASEQYQEKLKEKLAKESENGNDVQEVSEASFDSEVWVDAIGGIRKNRVYGFGKSEEAEKILALTQSSSSRRYICPTFTEDFEARIEAQVEERLKARMEAHIGAIEANMQKKFQEMLAQLQGHMPRASSNVEEGS